MDVVRSWPCIVFFLFQVTPVFAASAVTGIAAKISIVREEPSKKIWNFDGTVCNTFNYRPVNSEKSTPTGMIKVCFHFIFGE